MNNRIFIIAIPGIGTKEDGFSKGFQKDLEKFSKNAPLEGNYEVIECLPFKETNIDENQKALFNRLDEENNLGGVLSFRKTLMEAFGDGVTFERNAADINSPYQRIHGYLRRVIQETNKKMQDFPDSKLLIVASSMSSHILSTYVWDADHGKGIFKSIPANNQNNLKNLSYLVTLGSNIPLFVSGLAENQIIAFDKRNPDFTWDNYYDKDDVLGWPLKQLSNSYKNLVNDFQINTGLYVGSHVKYWSDNDFTKPFVQTLLELFNAM
ncbi:MAG: hypothetical protein JEZ09_17640 [Salinivirgaceae bacterium]|nr:hypothetical protein [Salinivirgaceae bacterium]